MVWYTNPELYQLLLNLQLYVLDDSQLEVEIDYTGVPNDKLPIAKILFETIGNVIGRSTRTTLSLKSNFYHLGGNSLNSIYTVTQLRDKGYFIGITEFIQAENLGQILTEISKEKVSETLKWEYETQSLCDGHKDQVFQ